MEKKEKLTLYGQVTSVIDLDAHYYLVDFKEDESGEMWEIIIDEKHLYCDLETGKYYQVEGFIITSGKRVILAHYMDDWGRYCDHCGKHHTEGWYVKEHMYACSDECAIALCEDEEDFRAGIIVDENGDLTDDAYTYWTEWE